MVGFLEIGVLSRIMRSSHPEVAVVLLPGETVRMISACC
jgi:hypothetical protein